MASSQRIKTTSGTGELANPDGLYKYIKPSRIIVVSSPPNDSIGEYLWYAIDSTTGKLYFRNYGESWIEIYEFPTGGGGGSVDNALNVGSGVGIFKDKIANILNFRSIKSNYQDDQAPVEILQTTDEINLTTLRSINYVEDFSPGEASIIKNVVFDGANSGTLFTKSFIAGSGISIAEINDKIQITNNGTSILRSWASQTNSFGSNIGLYFAGANQHYPFTFQMNTLSSGTIIFLTDVNVSYFYTTATQPRRYLISFSAYMQTSGLAQEQQITFGMAKNGNTNFEQRTATNIVFYSTPSPIAKTCSVFNSFIYNVLPNETYAIGMIPRQTNGNNSSYDIQNFILNIVDAE